MSNNACARRAYNIFRFVPVVIITAIVVWSYYAYVYVMCIDFGNSIAEKVLLIFFYHFTLLPFLASYFRTIFQPFKHPPKEFHLPRDELHELLSRRSEDNGAALAVYLKQIIAQRQLPVRSEDGAGAPRLCAKCCLIKPDRAHHCSTCGVCHLKMDHHCPWVGTCVAFHNYKFFVLFLVQTLVFCFYVVGTSVPYDIKFFQTVISDRDSPMSRINVVLLTFLGCVFSLSVIILFSYHIFLVLKNRSTLESSRYPVINGKTEPNAYNLGCKKNFLAVFGDSPWLWYLPVATSLGDGVDWEYAPSLEMTVQSSFIV